MRRALAARRARGRAAAAHRPRRSRACWPRATRSTAWSRAGTTARPPRLFTPQRRSRPPAGRAARRARGAARAPRRAAARRRPRARGRPARKLAPARRARPRRPRHHDGADRAAARADARVESVLPPVRACSRRSRRSRRRLASEPRLEALGALLAPGGRRRGRRCAACASRPRSTARSATPSRSRATARRRRRCASRATRGDVDLELELDADSGRLARVVLRPGGALTQPFVHRVGAVRLRRRRVRPARARRVQAARRAEHAAARLRPPRPRSPTGRPSNEPVTSRSAPSASGASAPMQ